MISKTVSFGALSILLLLLVANSDETAVNSIKGWNDYPYLYLRHGDANQVCFPDHMCGPDIIYKCIKTMTVYIVQVKFLNGISKQETVNACDTTDFYCKRKCDGVLKGFETMRRETLEAFKNLQKIGFSVQQMLFIHAGGNNTAYTQGQ